MSETPSIAPPDMLTVVAWNILLDKTRTRQGIITPQHQRINSLTATLVESGVAPDVVAIMEAENAKGHGGERIARALGFEAGFWYEHNRKNEHIGMFGDQVDTAESIELGYNKLAVMTMVGEVAVVGLHLKCEHWGPKRAEQLERVLAHLDGHESAIVMGDLNALPLEKAPRMLRKDGFESVYRQLGQKRPMTWPAPTYRDIMLTPWQQRLLPRGVNCDDIYIRNLTAVDAGSFMGDSDHAGVWATVRR